MPIITGNNPNFTREHFDAKIELLRADNSHTRWMLGVLTALAIANFAKQFF